MMLYVTMYLTLINLNRFSTLNNGDHVSPCSGLLSKHKKLFSEGMGKFTKGEAKLIISDSQTSVYAEARPLPYAIKEKVEDELSNMVKQNIIPPISHSNCRYTTRVTEKI